MFLIPVVCCFASLGFLCLFWFLFCFSGFQVSSLEKSVTVSVEMLQMHLVTTLRAGARTLITYSCDKFQVSSTQHFVLKMSCGRTDVALMEIQFHLLL